METILMMKRKKLSKKKSKSLNPFYIMETILMEVVMDFNYDRLRPMDGLNPFYIMETILISIKSNCPKIISFKVLIHSTSWKLFW